MPTFYAGQDADDVGGYLAALNALAGNGDMALQSAANTFSGLNTFASGTITTSKPVGITQTWNDVAVTFTALDVNVTDSASAAGSLLANLRIGGASKFSVNKAGDGIFAGDLAINGDDLTSSAAAFNLLATPTTVNAFGAASVALNIGHASAAAAFPGGISIANNKAVASGATATAFAGATTLLTLGGTGATAVVALPGTLNASGTTGALTVAGGIYIAKKLIVAGNIAATGAIEANTSYVWGAAGLYANTDGAATGKISAASSGSGSQTTYIGDSAISVTSDERIKENVRLWEGNASTILRSLPVKAWDRYLSDAPQGNYKGGYIGFTAQDMHVVAPWSVNTQGDTGLPWQARYEFLNGIIVKGWQEHEARLAALEAK